MKNDEIKTLFGDGRTVFRAALVKKLVKGAMSHHSGRHF